MLLISLDKILNFNSNILSVIVERLPSRRMFSCWGCSKCVHTSSGSPMVSLFNDVDVRFAAVSVYEKTVVNFAQYSNETS